MVRCDVCDMRIKAVHGMLIVLFSVLSLRLKKNQLRLTEKNNDRKQKLRSYTSGSKDPVGVQARTKKKEQNQAAVKHWSTGDRLGVQSDINISSCSCLSKICNDNIIFCEGVKENIDVAFRMSGLQFSTRDLTRGATPISNLAHRLKETVQLHYYLNTFDIFGM
jgi:hypothetical protein